MMKAGRRGSVHSVFLASSLLISETVQGHVVLRGQSYLSVVWSNTSSYHIWISIVI